MLIDLPAGATPASRAAGAIKSAIIEARFAPGQRLIESELTKLLGLGRGPVREALRALASEGLVAIEHNRGAVVTRASKVLVAEAFEIRELLEGLSARKSAERVSAQGCPTTLLDALHEEQTRDIESDSMTLMLANERLHTLIVSVGGNETVQRQLAQLQLPELRNLFFRVMSPSIWRTSREDHLAILEAIIAGDASGAEQHMRLHVRQTADLFANLPDSVLA